jgi:hypothetical protein
LEKNFAVKLLGGKKELVVRQLGKKELYFRGGKPPPFIL